MATRLYSDDVVTAPRAQNLQLPLVDIVVRCDHKFISQTACRL